MAWIIEHVYDVDGGFGDAVTEREAIGVVDTEEEADAYIEKYSHPIVYDKPYDELEYRCFDKREINKLDINVDPLNGERWEE